MNHFSTLKIKLITSCILLLYCLSFCQVRKFDIKNDTLWRTRENLALRFGSEFQKLNALKINLSSVSDIISEIRDFQLFPNELSGLDSNEIIRIDSILSSLEKSHSVLSKNLESLKPPLTSGIEILREMVTGVAIENMFDILEKGDMARINQMIEFKHQINDLWSKIDSLLAYVMIKIEITPLMDTTIRNSVHHEFFDIIQSALGNHLKLRYQRLELIKNHFVQNGSTEQVMEIYKIEKHRIKAMISKGNYFIAERKLESSIRRFSTKINIDDLHLLAFRTFFLENKYTEALENILKVSNKTSSDLKKLYRIQSLYALKRYHDILDEIPDTDISKFKGNQKNLLIWIFIESSLATGISINYSDFGMAIAKNAPYSIHVIHSLSRAYLKNQDTTTAISVLNGAFNYKINSEIENLALKKIKISLAQLHYERGNYDIALSTFFQLLNDDKDYGNALFGILWCYIKLNQYDKAEITMHKLINQSPESLYAAKASLVMAENYLYYAETEWNKIKYLDREKNRLEELNNRMAEKLTSDTTLKYNEPFNVANSELSQLLLRLKNESQKGHEYFVAIYNKIFNICHFIIDHYNSGTYQEEILSKNRENILYYLDSLNYSIKNDNAESILQSDTLSDKALIKAVANDAEAFLIHSKFAFLKWQLEYLDREKNFIHQNTDSSDSAISIAKLRIDSIIAKEDSTKQFFFFELTPLLNSFLKTNSNFADAAYFRYRLGELYYEHEITEYSQKFSRYEKELEAYLIMNDDYQNGKISKKPVPPDTVKLDHKNSISQFRYVIDNYSISPYCGASHYSLAWCYNDLEQVDSAITHMKKVVQDFPESPHAPQAWMYCGEFYFDRADLEQAANCYQAVMKYPESEWFDKALYKLAWSQYRQSNPHKAISSFLALVDLGENQPNGHSLLEKESLDYIAISFSETDIVGENGLVRANAFAKKLNRDNQGYQILHRLANVYRNQGRFDIAEKTYNIILNDYKNNPKNPVVESELVSVMENRLSPEKLDKLKVSFFEKYHSKGSWANTQTDSSVISEADSVANKFLYEAAISYHQLALQKGKSANYISALKTYRTFIDNYPLSPQTNECHYNLAEILFSTGDYYKAAEEYIAVSKLYHESKYRETAAWNAVVAAQNFLKEEQSGK